MATLSYSYADSTVVIEDLASEGHPMVHDLCRQHSGTVTAPRGWDLLDERSAVASDRRSRDDVPVGGRGAIDLRLVGA